MAYLSLARLTNIIDMWCFSVQCTHQEVIQFHIELGKVVWKSCKLLKLIVVIVVMFSHKLKEDLLVWEATECVVQTEPVVTFLRSPQPATTRRCVQLSTRSPVLGLLLVYNCFFCQFDYTFFGQVITGLASLVKCLKTIFRQTNTSMTTCYRLKMIEDGNLQAHWSIL